MKFKTALLVVLTLALSGCYLQDREEARPAPQPVKVMDDIQHEADQHPLHNSAP